MRQEFLTEELRGYFDVREFKEGKSRDQRRILSSTETISFTVSFEEGDERLKPFMQYAKSYEKDGKKRFSVSFKINYKCKWYDALAQEVERPDSAFLENKPFIAKMRYAVVTPQGAFIATTNNPIDKRAKGYWVNAIQFREADANPFTAMDGGVAAAPAAPVAPVAAPIPPVFTDERPELPY